MLGTAFSVYALSNYSFRRTPYDFKCATSRAPVLRSRGRIVSLSSGPNFSKMNDLACNCNYSLVDKSVGPFLRLELLSEELDQEGRPRKLSAISGALLSPFNRLHIEAFRSFAAPARGSASLMTVSPAMFIFTTALALAMDDGVRDVYGLAINDEIEQHRRLVAYLKRFGGSKIRVVDDSLSSVPDRVFYGGFGTIIRGDVETMFARGYSMVQRQTEKSCST